MKESFHKNYLTPYIQNQSIIFEIKDHIDNQLKLIIDEKEYFIPIKKLLNQSIIEAKEEEVKELLKERYGFKEFYREDPWWHNAYKFVIHKAYPKDAYSVSYKYKFNSLKTKEDNIFVKVTQKMEIQLGAPQYGLKVNFKD
ncbi:hypothetical protein PL321_18915 [Caloramator sp. mosi_1]|uniref:hypothetical protein n=1 Tax=Caloramator sp. mosi_1 TaxID=3023090 RepID=UPI00235DC422|nr:hypothetical protein [Caloramator sp. mosi_1]WDC84255.1 hypothetical protein PL321_18915 [Caloramator sp. mosi_1]